MKVLIYLPIIMALWFFGVGHLHRMKVNVFMNMDVNHNISILCVCVLCCEGCESVSACGNDDVFLVIWGWPLHGTKMSVFMHMDVNHHNVSHLWVSFYVMLHTYGIIIGVVAGCGSMRALVEDDIPLAVSAKE